MENSYRFFNNHKCKYFPCHSTQNEAAFNCLFCYCPLYGINECGGKFGYTKDGVKICTDCHLPHLPSYYDVVVEKIKSF